MVLLRVGILFVGSLILYDDAGVLVGLARWLLGEYFLRGCV
jgi:hypothetical protein